MRFIVLILFSSLVVSFNMYYYGDLFDIITITGHTDPDLEAEFSRRYWAIHCTRYCHQFWTGTYVHA